MMSKITKSSTTLPIPSTFTFDDSAKVGHKIVSRNICDEYFQLLEPIDYRRSDYRLDLGSSEFSEPERRDFRWSKFKGRLNLDSSEFYRQRLQASLFEESMDSHPNSRCIVSLRDMMMQCGYLQNHKRRLEHQETQINELMKFLVTREKAISLINKWGYLTAYDILSRGEVEWDVER